MKSTTMHQASHADEFPLLTILFMVIGAVTGGLEMSMQDIDLLSGIILKWVSIVSFTIVIIINLPKLWRVITGKAKKPE